MVATLTYAQVSPELPPTQNVTIERVEAFRVGIHTDSSGNTKVWLTAELEEAAESYNSTIGWAEAPALLHGAVLHGHMGGSAYGWISHAYVEAGILYIDLADVDYDFACGVRDRRYPKRSVAFYPPDWPTNPTPGRWNIRHIAFLPAPDGDQPAVKGMADISFSEVPDAPPSYLYTEGQYAMKTKAKPMRPDEMAAISDAPSLAAAWQLATGMKGGKANDAKAYCVFMAKKKKLTMPSAMKEWADANKEDYDFAAPSLPQFVDGYGGDPVAQAVYKLFSGMRDRAIEASGTEVANTTYPAELMDSLRQASERELVTTEFFKDFSDYVGYMLQSFDERLMSVSVAIVNLQHEGDDKNASPSYGESNAMTTTTALDQSVDYAADIASAVSSVRAEFQEAIAALKTENETLRTQLAAKDEEVDVLSTMFSEQQKVSEKRAIAEFADSMVNERRVKPCDRDALVAKLEGLDNRTQLEFGESKVTPRALIMNEIRERPPLWSDGKMPTGADDAPMFSSTREDRVKFDEGSNRDHMRVIAYSKEHSCSYAEAMDQLGIVT